VSRLYAMTKRELLAYFYAPVPYFVMFLFLMLTLAIVSLTLNSEMMRDSQVQVDYGVIFNWLDFLLLFLIPLLTMNSVADERSRNTIETLLTAPVTDWQVILSKWFGTFCFYTVMLVPTLVYWLVFRELVARGSPGIDTAARLDGGPILSAYLGALLLGGLYAAIGILASSLTENAPLSAFFAFVIILLLMVANVFSTFMPDSLRESADYVSQHTHFAEFLRGRIAFHDVFYFVSMTVFFLFLSVRALESRKWR
jgi:ABC-2 type transport system permease protein